MNSAIGVGDGPVTRVWWQGTAARNAAVAAIYFICYVLVDWVSYVQPVLKLGITPWNPQAGLTLAYLLAFGPRWLPVTAAAALMSEVIVRGHPVASPIVLASSLWIALGYGALATLLRRWKLDARIRTPIAGAWFTGASACASIVVAAGYVAIVAAGGELPRADAMGSVARYWVGDLNGMLNVTPLLIYLPVWREGLRLARQRRWEVAGQVVAVAATLWIVFGLSATDELRAFYLLFVPVIWIALRWGLPGAILATLCIQIALVVLARDETRAPPLIDLQFLMVTLSATALLLGAVIVERTGVLRRVARSEAQQRALLAMAPDAVLAIDRAGRIQSANPAALRLFGETAGSRVSASADVLLPGLALTGEQGRAALEGCRDDGTHFPAEVAWARLDEPAGEGFLITVRDVSERRRAQEELRARDSALSRAMRFAVAGELASALAHELNQPMTAVVSYLRSLATLTEPYVAQDERIGSTLGKTTHEAIRAAKVLRRLRDFYRGGTSKRESIDIAELCGAVATAFEERLRRASTALVVRVDPVVAPIQWDATQLEIVLHNLVANSLDAVTHTDKPWRRIELSAERSAANLVLQVSDSGSGLSPDVLEHLFEPFTTTRADGMGLGLAISRSLVRARGGDLLHEARGKLGGATFTVRIPYVEQ
jgi:signal transduction histidine kinase